MTNMKIKYLYLYNLDYRIVPILKVANGNINDINVQRPKETGPQFIILLAYMHGRSTFAGTLLGQHPQLFYWYEFLWDVYNPMLPSDYICIVPAGTRCVSRIWFKPAKRNASK